MAASSYVFVSYASADRERVLPVVAALERAGVPAWIDQRGIAGGANYAQEIAEAIKGAAALLLCCSPAALGSRNVRQEIALAWRYATPYLPLRLDPVAIPDDLAYWLEAAQWVDVLDNAEADWLAAALGALARLGIAAGVVAPQPVAGTAAADDAPRAARPEVAVPDRGGERGQAIAALPRGTVTLLFAEVEEPTELLLRLGERYPGALGDYRRLLRATCAAHGGAEVDGHAESFLFAFAGAGEAVAAAVEAQRALAGHPWPEEVGLRARMGLHTGEPTHLGETYIGMDLHHAARVGAAAHGGQLLLSPTTAALVMHAPPPGTTLRDLGPHRLKDLAHPEHLYHLVVGDLPGDFPPPRTLERHAHNLPLQPTPLIGREAAVRAVCATLRGDATRLLTLTGPGGIGKTRLALQVAAELIADFPDGAWFVNLAPLTDPALVPAALAQVLGVQESAEVPLDAALAAHLREHRALLVLDNFEQVTGAAIGVAALLAACPALRALATSRLPLRLAGEREYPVPPLALPDRRRAVSAEALSGYEAVRLFIERAQAVKPDFAVTNATAPAVAEICRRLDGLPLAIELAAARARLLPPPALLARLERRLAVLTGGPQDRPDRQRTLRGAIDWSHDLLDAGERALFRRLAVFVGGRTLEAIEAVCNADGDLPLDALDGVEALVRHSLLRQEEGVGGEPRFVMLETIHEYARERLAASGEEEALRARHAAYFLALAEESQGHLEDSEQALWLARLEEEHNNLRAALGWSLDRGDSAQGLGLTTTLWRFWEMRCHFTEGLRWLERALPHAAASPEQAADLHTGAGTMAWRLGDYARATALHEAALARFREAGDRSGVAFALNNIATQYLMQGDYLATVALYEEALALAREIGDARMIMYVTHNLGELARYRGEYRLATTWYEESLAQGRVQANGWVVAMNLNWLGVALQHLGDVGRAATRHLEGLALGRELGDQRLLVECVESLAGIATAIGQPITAARLLGAAEAHRGALHAPLSPSDRAELDRTVVATRDAIGPERFAAEAAAGRELAIEQAVELATAIGRAAP